jgi:hypothetical protein
MSTKPKSKSASATSLPPGTPSAAKSSALNGEAEVGARADVVTVYLLADRSRRASWMLGGLVIGGLLIWKFGTVAAAGGAILMAMGLYHTWFFVQTLRHEGGAVTIDASARQVSLPTGLCRGAPTRVPSATIGAAYFLRQAVPWNRSAPVLVIETAERAYVYPRDWFASEADQRRIMHAVIPLIATHAAGDSSAKAHRSASAPGE